MVYHIIMNGKEVIKKLKANGWFVKRIRGSHHMMSDGSKAEHVAVHRGKDIPIGTLKSIEKLTGVKLK